MNKKDLFIYSKESKYYIYPIYIYYMSESFSKYANLLLLYLFIVYIYKLVCSNDHGSKESVVESIM